MRALPADGVGLHVVIQNSSGFHGSGILPAPSPFSSRRRSPWADQGDGTADNGGKRSEPLSTSEQGYPIAANVWKVRLPGTTRACAVAPVANVRGRAVSRRLTGLCRNLFAPQSGVLRLESPGGNGWGKPK